MSASANMTDHLHTSGILGFGSMPSTTGEASCPTIAAFAISYLRAPNQSALAYLLQ